MSRNPARYYSAELCCWLKRRPIFCTFRKESHGPGVQTTGWQLLLLNCLHLLHGVPAVKSRNTDGLPVQKATILEKKKKKKDQRLGLKSFNYMCELNWKQTYQEIKEYKRLCTIHPVPPIIVPSHTLIFLVIWFLESHDLSSSDTKGS